MARRSYRWCSGGDSGNDCVTLVRFVAVLCALALFFSPMCGPKCFEPGCAFPANQVAQKSDDCHGSAAVETDDSRLAITGSLHRCSGSEQPVAVFAEVKLTAAAQPSVGVDSVSSTHVITPSDLLSFAFGPRAVVDRTGGVPFSSLPSAVLRI